MKILLVKNKILESLSERKLPENCEEHIFCDSTEKKEERRIVVILRSFCCSTIAYYHKIFGFVKR